MIVLPGVHTLTAVSIEVALTYILGTLLNLRGLQEVRFIVASVQLLSPSSPAAWLLQMVTHQTAVASVRELHILVLVSCLTHASVVPHCLIWPSACM